MVTLSGKDFYLGKWNSKASRQEYDRLIGDWLARGRRLPDAEEQQQFTVAELCASYWRYAKAYYRKDGRPTGTIDQIRQSIRWLRKSYAATDVTEFGPLKLQAVREMIVESGVCRGYVNQRIDTIKRIFRWGVAQELAPAGIHQALDAVVNLHQGRTAAPDHPPVVPVDDDIVDATLPHAPQVIGDMIRLQRLTGCRPGEICIMRPCDIDRSGDVWIYRPHSHKTQHHGHKRTICIGPQAQDVLRPYLLRKDTAYCFSPAESEKRRRARAHAARKTPMSCGNKPGSNRRRRPKRKPQGRCDTNSYRRAIHRAVDKANRDRAKQSEEMGVELEPLPRWSPNRLRHAAATEIREQFDLESAQVVLGHSKCDMTERYAQQNLALAAEVARKIG